MRARQPTAPQHTRIWDFSVQSGRQVQRYCAHLALSGLMKSTGSRADAEHIKTINSELQQAQNDDLKRGAVEVTLFLASSSCPAVLMGQEEGGLKMQAGEPGLPVFWAKILISVL